MTKISKQTRPPQARRHRASRRQRAHRRPSRSSRCSSACLQTTSHTLSSFTLGHFFSTPLRPPPRRAYPAAAGSFPPSSYTLRHRHTRPPAVSARHFPHSTYTPPPHTSPSPSPSPSVTVAGEPSLMRVLELPRHTPRRCRQPWPIGPVTTEARTPAA